MSDRAVAGTTWFLLAGASAGLGWTIAEVALKSEHGETASLIATGACLAALALAKIARAAARRRGQREVREHGLRSRNPAAGEARTVSGQGGSSSARLDEHGIRDILGRLDAESCARERWERDQGAVLDAVAAVVLRACEEEGQEPPAALQPAAKTQPLPPVWLAAADGDQVGA